MALFRMCLEAELLGLADVGAKEERMTGMGAIHFLRWGTLEKRVQSEKQDFSLDKNRYRHINSENRLVVVMGGRAVR